MVALDLQLFVMSFCQNSNIKEADICALLHHFPQVINSVALKVQKKKANKYWANDS
jgi:hypothetical protein